PFASKSRRQSMSSCRFPVCPMVREKSSAYPKSPEWKVPLLQRKNYSCSSDPVMTKRIEFVEHSVQPGSAQCLQNDCKLMAFDFRSMLSHVIHGREAVGKYVATNSVALDLPGNNGPRNELLLLLCGYAAQPAQNEGASCCNSGNKSAK